MSAEREKLRDRIGSDPGYNDYVAAGRWVRSLASEENEEIIRVRLAVLGNCTLEPVMPVIRGELALDRIVVDAYMGRFDAVHDEALNPGSGFRKFGADAVILGLWLEALTPDITVRFAGVDEKRTQDVIDDVTTRVRDMVALLRRTTQSPILLNNFPLPRWPAYGLLDGAMSSGQVQVVESLNSAIRAASATFADVWLADWRQLLSAVGSERGVDERLWRQARIPLSQEGWVAVGGLYARMIRAWRGRAKKCLVLDCDDTLWGGVIGEDGLHGIQLGEEYPGNCYTTFQREVLNLHDRGVILALCSRNNEADVLQVLKMHPSSVLREEHFATWEINWEPKSANLRRIAQSLNIGLDSMVFVDDSAFECDAVRRALPEVTVVQLSSEPSAHLASIRRHGWFDTLAVSTEDQKRNRMYREECCRRNLRETAETLEEYLKSLQLQAEIRRPVPEDVPRVAQLTQKTNQFNLTVRRRTEGEIRALLADDGAEVFCMSLRDRVSDLGIVGVAVVRYKGDTGEIDTFLLSCRALGRGAEDALLSAVADASKARGCSRLRGIYQPTAKNGQVAEFYPQRGFEVAQVCDGDKVAWELTLVQPVQRPGWISIVTKEA